MKIKICSVCEREVSAQDLIDSGQAQTKTADETCPFCGHELAPKANKTKANKIEEVELEAVSESEKGEQS